MWASSSTSPLARATGSTSRCLPRILPRRRSMRCSPRTISTGATVRPTIWPTAILNEGDSLAFDILAVASPDPGSDLTVVIQT